MHGGGGRDETREMQVQVQVQARTRAAGNRIPFQSKRNVDPFLVLRLHAAQQAQRPYYAYTYGVPCMCRREREREKWRTVRDYN